MTKNNKLRKIVEISRELICSLLFPLRCPICDEILSPEETKKGIHLACENKLYPVTGAVCMHCGRPLGHKKSPYEFRKLNKEKNNQLLDGISDVIPMYLTPESTFEYCYECERKGYNKSSSVTQGKALYLYKGAIKKSMYRLKYANKREYASFYAKQAVERYGNWIAQSQVIIPVPSYHKKKKLRGYNQAEVLAEEISKLTDIQVEKNALIRIKDTTPQKELNYHQRKNNLENAFQKNKSIVQYSHILVVDDIYTTGCTAEAVAEELRKQGVRHIYVLSICIGGNE